MKLDTFDKELARFVQDNPAYDNAAINEFRRREYPALDNEVNFGGYKGPGHAYLDYTAGNLVPKSLVELSAKLLTEQVLGNPHSRNPTSDLSSVLMDEARERVLTYFNANKNYSCVFTANASGSLRIVGECYPFNENSAYAYLEDDHNSVIGIRQYAHAKGASLHCISLEDNFSVDKNGLRSFLAGDSFQKDANKLFAYPAQSNATGVKHDQELTRIAKEAGWDVLLDAAAYVSTNQLQLDGDDMNALPDYVCISFYKMFGYPTGIGCLLIKKQPEDTNTSAFAKLWYNKPFFAGGTVESIVSNSENLVADEDHTCDFSKDQMNYVLKMNYECFEDGTVNYHNIPAVKTGLDYLEQRNGPGGDGIRRHVSMLMKWLVEDLKQVYYPGTTQRVAVVCGEDYNCEWGSTILVKFYKPDGSQVWAGRLEDELGLFNAEPDHHKLSVRIGTFCNPGVDSACSKHSQAFHSRRLKEAQSRRPTFSYAEPYNIKLAPITERRQEPQGIMNQDGNYPGGVRVSLGIASNFHDLYVFRQFVAWVMQALGS